MNLAALHIPTATKDLKITTRESGVVSGQSTDVDLGVTLVMKINGRMMRRTCPEGSEVGQERNSVKTEIDIRNDESTGKGGIGIGQEVLIIKEEVIHSLKLLDGVL